MLILLAIFLLIFVPVVMLILYLLRPKSGFQGFLAVLTVLVCWILILLARSNISQVITLISWESNNISTVSPSLVIDDTSWYFALALISLALSLIVISIAQLGQSRKPAQAQGMPRVEVVEVQGQSDEVLPTDQSIVQQENSVSTNWRSWAGILILTSLGLVAVTAGNMLTLLLAWAAMDVIELLILMAQAQDNRSRERVILAFSARMAGIALVLLAGVIPWSQGISLSYDAISQSTSLYLLLAAGLRLGVLPLNLALIQDHSQRRGLGTALRLVPAASSYILLVRVANIGVVGAATVFLLGLTALAGLFAARNWVISRDELTGRHFWLIGTASLVIASAILNRPGAAIAWSIASILSGGLVFSLSIRHKKILPIILLGLINFSSLPFTPTWLGTGLYQYSGPITSIINPIGFYGFSLLFLLINAILLAGFMRHTLREIIPAYQISTEHIERWVWFLYPIGLLLIIASHLYIGFRLLPILSEVPLTGWIMGAVVSLLAGIFWVITWRYPQYISAREKSTGASLFYRYISLAWLYQLIWRLYRLMAKVFAFISTVLEGEGGILWALVLFVLIFIFLQQ